MESLIPENEYTEVDGRLYANPQAALDRQNTFIDNLRANQAQQNQQIAQDTYNLGTDISSSQGGLGTNTPANMSYFTSRYQTPQTNSVVANLRAAAQAQALNQVLENEQEIWKKRYQDAYRNYQKRMYDKANTPTTSQNPSTRGEVKEGDTSFISQGKLVLGSEDFVPEGSRVVDPDTGAIISDPGAYLVDPVSGNIIGEGYNGSNPLYIRNANGSYTKVNNNSASKTPWQPPLAGAIRSTL